MMGAIHRIAQGPASALVVARRVADGIEVVTTASTGNAAAALAGLAASVGCPP